jgi:hypothetical protein
VQSKYYVMQASLTKNVIDTFKDLNNTIWDFNEEKLNSIPFKNSWTAGQVVEHIIKSLAGLTSIMNGPVEEPKRNADENVKNITATFLNYTIKMQSPEFILPSADKHKKDTLISSLDKLENEMLAAVQQDLTTLCTAFEFPSVGKLTKIEWITFFICHTQRHTQQLKDIYQAIANNNFHDAN